MSFIAGNSGAGLEEPVLTPSATSPELAPVTWAWAAGTDARVLWDSWAVQTRAWLDAHGADPREAIVVLPVGAVLVQARQAWSRAVGGWQPRIDTIASLADTMAWSWTPPERGAGMAPLSMDPVLDRLQAARSLGQEPWGQQWARRDRRGFDFALDQLVAAAHGWARRLQAFPPLVREAYGETARAALKASASSGEIGQGPGGRERLLLAWALEWSLDAGQRGWPSDALYALKPSAWVGVTAGECVSPGTEADLMLAVMRQAAGQGMKVCWQAAMPEWASAHEAGCQPALGACADAEDEAQQAAAQVLTAVNAARVRSGSDPVALIALDRSLIRRARALLEGAGAAVADETGWRLSTTRAATVFTRLIQASHPRASTDDLLDWLKSGWLNVQEGDAAALLPGCMALESWCRRHGLMGAWGLLPDGEEVMPDGVQAMPPEAVALWRWAKEVVAPLQRLWQGPRFSLQSGLEALAMALQRGGADVTLAADPAGALAWASLRLDQVGEATQADASWHDLSRHTMLDGPSLLRWVNTVLEATTFRPEAPDTEADVVITPMARALLRPFSAIILPGADERQLGAMRAPTGWLSASLSEAMGLATPASLREAQWEAFALLMSRPNVVCLYKKGQGSEPLEPSPWPARWADLGQTTLVSSEDARPLSTVRRQPLRPPQPSLPQGHLQLPEAVSATAYEALRQCPYRFFAASLLRLREAEELEEGLDRSDFGNWLHEVLRLFHERRSSQLALSDAAQDTAAWLQAAQDVSHSQGLDRDNARPWFLPFQAGLSRLAQAYVAWLRPHEDAGWSLRASEWARERTLDLGDGLQVVLKGQLDRLDVQHGPEGETRFVLDYKTGSLGTLKEKIKAPLEDTQLAFYAALAEPDAGTPAAHELKAAYLHIEPKAVTLLPHADIDAAANALLQGLGTDWRRLHEGASMPALGEGVACTYCQVRGLCRRDHWTLQSSPT
jgi:ATP-dependent helicase/nuclease subunit B